MDLSRVLAGPYCTMTLADLGADVVKVERPGVGDETRDWGPPYAGDQAAYFLSANRGKRSCAIDLKHEEGRALALDLCAGADVVIENFRPGAAAGLGVGYEDVRTRNPGVVYCSITGFGSRRDPPDRPGYDFIAQAESGLMAITGDPDAAPSKVGVALVDVLAGLNCATAIVAALLRRERTGEGEQIEVSLLDSVFAALVNVAAGALVTGAEPSRFGNAHPNIVPYQSFRTTDGWVAIAAANDGLYRRLCAVIGRPELAEDPRYATNPDRVRRRADLVPELERTLLTRSADDWVQDLSAVGVPAGKIRGVLEGLRTAEHAGEPATLAVDHPTAGRLDLVRPPFRLQSGEVASTPPPLLGEHTEEVLSALGCPAERIAALERAGVIERHSSASRGGSASEARG